MADHIVRPIIRSIIRPIIRAITAPAGSGGSAYTPAEIFDTYTGAYFTAYDDTYMTVNSNGTGGIPADGTAARRLTDRSGGGFHLLRASGVAPTNGGDALVIPVVPGIGAINMQSTANAFAGSTQNFTMLWYGDTFGVPEGSYAALDNNSGANFEFYGDGNAGLLRVYSNTAGIINTSIKQESVRGPIVVRGSATAFEVWCCGQYFTRAALPVETLKDLNLGGGFQTKTRLYEWVVVKAALTDVELTKLRTYADTIANRATINTDVLLARGDSITAGAGSEMAKPAIARMTQMPNAKKYCYGRSGEPAFSPSSGTAAALNTLYKGAGRNVIIFMMGTNDAVSFGRTAAQIETAIRNYCATMYAAGWTVIVRTLADCAGFTTVINDANTLIRANALSVPYAHGISDVGADARFQNSANTTYFNGDGVHWNDTLHQAAAEIDDIAVAAAP